MTARPPARWPGGRAGVKPFRNGLVADRQEVRLQDSRRDGQQTVFDQGPQENQSSWAESDSGAAHRFWTKRA